MISEGIKDLEVSIYIKYIERIMQQHDLIWSTFKVYLTVNSGAVLVIGFLYKDKISVENFSISNYLIFVSCIVAVFGIGFSICWFLANKDQFLWQNFIEEITIKAEDHIFSDPDNYALYKNIRKRAAPRKIDVAQINQYVSILFILMWTTFLIFMIIYKAGLIYIIF